MEETVLTTSELSLRRFLEDTYKAYEKTQNELEEIDVLDRYGWYTGICSISCFRAGNRDLGFYK